MSERRVLSSEAVAERLSQLTGWTLRDGRLVRELQFRSFAHAFGFMSSVALIAERMNHHPAFYNVYDRVTLTLWTHDAGGITPLDFELAEAVEALQAGR